jgi:CubicO group peptidase (beta-lactamase class C family)
MTSSRLSRRSAFGLLGAAPVAVSVAVGEPARAGSTSAHVPRDLRPGGAFDRFLAQLAAEDKFSGTVLLEHRSRPVLERAYGMADQSRSIPNEMGTIYCLASVTKLFTSIAIAQLAQQGKLSYHDKVGKHLDGFAPELADVVTIHQLLTHSSGLGNFMEIGNYRQEAPTWDSVEEAWEGTLKYVRMDWLRWAPGSGNLYSNSGFVILGAIVARLAEMPYYDYIRQHVFEPSRTSVADFYTAPQWRTDRRIAHPYRKDGNGKNVDLVNDHQTFIGTPAGGSFASAGDLSRIVKALLRGDLIGDQYLYLAMSPKLPRDVPGSFGNYLTIGSLTNNQWVVGHGGGGPGVAANIHWFPDSDWFFAVLSNYHDATGEVVKMATQLITQ